MEISRLNYWLKDMTPTMKLVGGRVFVDRQSSPDGGLEKKIAEAGGVLEAQAWINIVPVTAFLEEASGPDWELDDPDVQGILNTLASIWRARLAAEFPGVSAAVEIWKDKADGDVGLRLVQPGGPESAN